MFWLVVLNTHDWLDGHEFEQFPGVGDGQGFMGLQRVGHKWATKLNWTEHVNDDALLQIIY